MIGTPEELNRKSEVSIWPFPATLLVPPTAVPEKVLVEVMVNS